MKRIIVQLLVIFSLAFAPVGQAMVGGGMDQIEMDMMMSDCVDCEQHPDLAQSPCIDADCFSEACISSGGTSVYFYTSIDSQVFNLEFSVPISERYKASFLSQVSQPLCRPPIT